MLKKLLKYDLKWIYKNLLVFYSLSLFFTIVTRCCFELSSTMFNLVGQISQVIAISMAISALINSFMRAWVRYKQNFYGDESYLTHTLPIDKKTLYLSKILTGVISMLTTIVIILIDLAIMFYSKENMLALEASLDIFASAYNSSVFSLLLSFSCVFFFQMSMMLIIGYIGITIGHRANSNKMIKSIVSAFLLYLGTQTLMLLITFIIGTFNPDIMRMFTSNDQINVETLKMIISIITYTYLIFIVIYYFIGEKIFEKGVNVD